MGKGKEKKLSSKAQAEVDLEAANVDRAGAAFGVQLAALNKLNEVGSASGSTDCACSPTATIFIILLKWIIGRVGVPVSAAPSAVVNPAMPMSPARSPLEIGTQPPKSQQTVDSSAIFILELPMHCDAHICSVAFWMVNLTRPWSERSIFLELVPSCCLMPAGQRYSQA